MGHHSFFERMAVRYLSTFWSTQSTAPMVLLQCLIKNCWPTSTLFPSDLDQRLVFWTGQTPTLLQTALTTLLSFHLTTASPFFVSHAWSNVPRGAFSIFSTKVRGQYPMRLERIVPVQAMFFSVRLSTRLSDVNRLPNVRWKESPVSVQSSEIKSTTTDPPILNPGYTTCLPRASRYGWNWKTYTRGVVNTRILQPKRTGFSLMNGLQPCLSKYGTTDSSIFEVLGFAESEIHEKPLIQHVYKRPFFAHFETEQQQKTFKILWEIAVIRHLSQEI